MKQIHRNTLTAPQPETALSRKVLLLAVLFAVLFVAAEFIGALVQRRHPPRLLYWLFDLLKGRPVIDSWFPDATHILILCGLAIVSFQWYQYFADLRELRRKGGAPR